MSHKKIKNNDFYFLIICGIFSKLILVFFLSSFGLLIIGTEQDALSYSTIGFNFAKFGIFDRISSDKLYPYILGVIYYASYPDHLIGKLLSVFIWLVSFLFFLNCLRIFKVDNKYKIIVSLIYIFLPSSIFFNSFTFREPIQLLLVIIFCYLMITINFKKITFTFFYSYLVLFAFLIFFSSYFHSILPVYFSILLIIGLLNFYYFINIKYIKIYPILIIFLFLFIYISNIDQNFINQIINFRNNETFFNARTSYGNGIDINEGKIFKYLYIFKMYLFYYIKPFWFEVESNMDLVVLFDNSIKIMLILFCFLVSIKKLLINKIFYLNPNFLNVFLMYIILEFFWSIGSSTWGTAIRHHSTATGLLLINVAFLLNFAFKKK